MCQVQKLIGNDATGEAGDALRPAVTIDAPSAVVTAVVTVVVAVTVVATDRQLLYASISLLSGFVSLCLRLALNVSHRLLADQQLFTVRITNRLGRD